VLLDKLDLMIIEELKEDVRQSVHALAKKLGMKRTTLTYRLNRLRSDDILRIACVGDPELLGYQFLLLIGINVTPGKVDEVVNEIVPLPAVSVVALTAGRYNILAWALLRDRPAFANLVSENLTKIPYVISIDLMPSFQWVRGDLNYFKSNVGTVRKPPKNSPSDIDLSIVRAMEIDPRQTIATLARTVGCSRSIAKSKLEKLLSDGIIRFVSLVDPKALKYEIGVVILVKSQVDKLYAVAKELSIHSTSTHVNLITGQWQIFVAAQFENNEEMYNYMSNTLSSIPGIVEFEVIHIVKILKYSFSSFLGST
jgi:DNA-binding Lrp family transcriptional regulator